VVTSSGFSRGRARQWLALASSALLTALSGCGFGDDRYPIDLKYPQRTDPIVAAPLPEAQPSYPDSPGRLDELIARIGKPKDQEGFGGKILEPRDVEASQRREIREELLAIFGTPAEPSVTVPEEGLTSAQTAKLGTAVDRLKLDDDTLYRGSMLYRRHCLHCHGVPGDGRGPTGPWLNPHPRDYRVGLFKFISTALKRKDGGPLERKPRRDDLLRTLRQGIDGTSMPSFAMQSNQDLEALVSYVIHLSLRGEVELDTFKTLLEKEPLVKGRQDPTATIQTHMRNRFALYLERWLDSGEAGPLSPEQEYREGDLMKSRQRGYALFIDTQGTASCILCHLDFGRQVPYRFDSWGTLVRPANLTAGAYRGGRRPIDLYWRIRGGILGSGMPGMPPPTTKSADADPYWDIVNFVQALPYPNMLPAEVRGKIYPSLESSAKEKLAQAD
jgi:mono/diheme cytochrome c family protein